jgi:hypothetical protein
MQNKPRGEMLSVIFSEFHALIQMLPLWNLCFKVMHSEVKEDLQTELAKVLHGL